MLKAMLPHAAAFAVALISVLALRFAAGPVRGPRWAGAGVALGIMVGLSLIVGFSWSAAGPVNRVGHIVLGAVLVGAALDQLGPPRIVRWVVLGVFALGCAWASVLGGLRPEAALTGLQLGLIALLAVVWWGLTVRIQALSAEKASSLVVALSLAAGLAVLAAVAGDRALTFAALCALAALFALALVSIFVVVEMSAAAMVPMAGALIAVAWGLAVRHPETLVGLPILALILFAERTARRVPMPGGRISAYLFLLVLAAFCAIPIVIAALLARAGVTA